MIRAILNIYIMLLIVDAVLSYFPQYNKNNWARKIKMLADLTLNPIRKYIVQKLPMQDLPIDISPIIFIVILKTIEALW
ncbi:MAG: hypothetical protein A2381_15510 [Bdellovibrionales bacterium RIFOXYB1_FULL_37_110]|nr:MAG: hypothetical protein A2417_07360 [Bdellovibrionales bacterium RIFOXYC1_FULL_37_79]OFZ52676.1 MAG: hypothetical protein A2328_06105 [Bdellovibrionales bacterium RIFOXYB2_FULL_36_6]OFZ57029.1 MAG: hypothetical protein A2381_15510 [Bdellovibrionales bacterium RIFOXYB1_FULL_37_110]OFZ64028.1 MAG: hypothetical protein A2577_16125 [Bdellovibrionales bacterium RIFOXYD1_FULL_36_51]